MKANILPLKINFSRWHNRNGERSVASPLIGESEGELMMHFRVFDLAAERCVWSIPPIAYGLKLEDLVTQLLADRRVARLNIRLATDDSYAGYAVRFNVQ